MKSSIPGRKNHVVAVKESGPLIFDKQSGESTEKMLEIPEAANLFGWSVKAFRLRVSRGQVPHYKIGRRIYFTLSQLIDWRERHLVLPRNGPIPLLKRRY